MLDSSFTYLFFFFFSSRRRHTRLQGDWSSDVCSSDLAYLQQRDTAGYGKALEKLLTYYPKRDYWLNLVYGIAARPGFSERLALDIARLKIETGTMRTGNEYLEAAQLSLIDGFPAEAARIIDKGYAAGLLGSGPE